MRNRAVVTLAALLVVLAGCSTTGASSSRSGGSRNLILAEELMEIERSNAYEAVRRLRPRWLQSRGAGSIGTLERDTPRIYVDGQLYGEAESLRTLDTREIQELRYMSASDATTRYGTNHTAGAILVVTRRR